MEKTYRSKANEISMSLLKSLKSLFKDQEVEIIIKSIDHKKIGLSESTNKRLLEMIRNNCQNAPVISPNVDIRGLIDKTHTPKDS